MATRWRLSTGQSLLRRQWDGECVLYNDLSGDTHLLGADALRLLLALEAGAADTAHAPAGDAAGLDALLEQLQDLGLVEAVC